MKKPRRLFGIRGIEDSPLWRLFFYKSEALDVGCEEAVARGCPQLTEALTQDFAKLFIMGRAEEARTILIRLGTRKFGTPAEEVEARITAMVDLENLEDLIDRVFEVASWDELLAAAGSELFWETFMDLGTRPTQPTAPPIPPDPGR
jgi:hypothetical protein